MLTARHGGYAVLELENVSYKSPLTSTDDPPWLTEISVQCAAGQLTWVVGPSGSGKTTLLRVAQGVLLASTGSVSFDGQQMSSLGKDERAAMRRRIALLEAQPRLLRGQSLLDNVILPLKLAGQPADVCRQRAKEVMADVGVMHKASRRPDQVGPSDRHRAALARALASAPSVILVDEPGALFDPELVAQRLELLREAVTRGAACLVVSCDASLRLKGEEIQYLTGGGA